jgi:hypothetical protein
LRRTVRTLAPWSLLALPSVPRGPVGAVVLMLLGIAIIAIAIRRHVRDRR